MTTYRNDLPHETGGVLLTDAGLETVLIFDQGMELPDFASFPLVETKAGRTTLLDYYRPFVGLARDHGVDVVLETPTWRASAGWGARLGYDGASLRSINMAAVDLLRQIREEHEGDGTKVVISGNVGPRGDGYVAGEQMTVEDAQAYHQPQIDALADGGADLITVLTMTYVEEAIGITEAATAAGMPIVVSFTVETDGRLPSGQRLRDAIVQVDTATDAAPVFFGINCAHPDHFTDVLTSGEGWTRRIGLLRANASRMSHEELDEAEELDAGDPEELGAQYADLRKRFPSLVVLGGCCGTDERHVAHIGRAITSGVAA